MAKKEKVTPVREDEADNIRVTIEMDDGESVECLILTILTVAKKDYVALLPLDENDQPNEQGEVYLYRYLEDEEGIPSIDNIYDDEEYEAVFDAFDEWQDAELFDSMD